MHKAQQTGSHHFTNFCCALTDNHASRFTVGIAFLTLLGLQLVVEELHRPIVLSCLHLLVQHGVLYETAVN